LFNFIKIPVDYYSLNRIRIIKDLKNVYNLEIINIRLLL
jgi:hypothetical protein